ncbi:MAG: hypothetical protein CL507_02145 [Actinobacteria bacterium]|jgi:hypothetical protein|nr:hypothetical protein [Actinomycetota bacterium]|tara:strand:- start:798 stop:2021 length:1224 start_codon:yes stop_codon:yes gene_type:complete
MNYIIANTVIILFFLLSPLNAHYFSESFSKWNVVDNKVEANFSLLTLESTRIFQVENYQKIMFEENLSETDVFKIYLSQHLKVTSEGKSCSLVDEIKELNSQEGSLNLSLNFECPSNKEIKIINNALFNLVQSHIHIARIYIDNNLYTEKALFFNDQSIDLNEEKENNSFSNSFYKFFSLGLDHILSGYDHLLFILGLLLLVTNLKRLLLVITGFTIGHSLTLSLSVINIIQVKSSLVEALIGYTIMFVGLEYLYKENNDHRVSMIFITTLSLLLLIFGNLINPNFPYFLILGILLFSLGYFYLLKNLNSENNLLSIITIIFGLIHGFGFGGFLLGSKISSENIFSGLLGFNLGVEVGQIIFVLLILLIYKLLMTLKITKIIEVMKNLSFFAVVFFGFFFFIQRLIA